MLFFYLANIEDPVHQSIFLELYNKYDKAFLAFAKSAVSDEYEAEQAVIETFLILSRNIAKIAAMEENAQRVYLYTILSRCCKHEVKILKKHNDYICNDEMDTIADDKDISKIVESNETYQRIIELIETTPKNMRDALALHFINEFKAPLIAKMLKIPESTVRLWLKKGKAMLQNAIRKENLYDDNRKSAH